jgi:hypothetical protein
MGCVRRRRRYPCAMLQLDDMDNEIIRRAPKGAVYRLAALFHVSPRQIKRIRSGDRGLPLQSGLGARPHLLRTQNALDKWRTHQHAQTEAKYRRGQECIDRDEPVSITLTREEKMALMPCAPGELGVFEGALVIKPRTPPPAPPAALRASVPAKSQSGLFYDRR